MSSGQDRSAKPSNQAPDGGYGWIILGASFFINFMLDGVCFSFGIFFIEFLDHYDESKETTSWVGSVLNGMYLAIGPIVGAFANKFGCRRVAITGSLLASGGLILSTFSPNIYVLIITYGLLTGVGFGLMYLPAIVMVGYYFEKRRALATGIAVCGSGIGAFVFAPLCERLIATYAWKGATWIIGGICLNGIVCGALFRPLGERPRRRSRPELARKCPSEAKAENGVVNAPCRPNPVDDANTKFIQSMHDLSAPSGGTAARGSALSWSCDDLRGRMRAPKPGAGHRRMAELKAPLYRKDIFYSGSVLHLPDYRSVTSVSENSPSEGGRPKAKSNSMADTLKQMMDFSLLKNPVFCIYGTSCFLCMTGFFVPFTYLPEMALTYGMSRDQAAFLVSIIGIANTVARVACGWISDQPWADCLIINNCALLVGGLATMLCPFCVNYPLLGTYTFVFGSSIAAFVSLRSIIMVELMGLEKLTNAFGLVTLCQGLSSFIGAPIAGALFDATGFYNLSFYVAGSTLAMAGVICFPLRRVAIWWKRRTLNKAVDKNGICECEVKPLKDDKTATGQVKNGDVEHLSV